MLYKLLPVVLLLAVAVDAPAQTAPARNAKTTTRPQAAPQRSAAAKTASPGTMVGAPAAAKGQSQSIYAAPGQPIIVEEGKVAPYDGPAARRKTTKGGTTLSPR